MDDSGQIPLGLAGASTNDELNLVMSGDRYLAFIQQALQRYQKLNDGRMALFRGDFAGGAAQLQALRDEVTSSFRQNSAQLAQFRANLQTSMFGERQRRPAWARHARLTRDWGGQRVARGVRSPPGHPELQSLVQQYDR